MWRGTDERHKYTWDHRNRLVRIQVRDAQGTLLRDIQYVYDVFDRRIGKAVDSDGDGPQGVAVSRHVLDNPSVVTGAAVRRYVLANPSVITGAADPALVGADHIVLEFAGEQPAALHHRYLHGPVVDQIFARGHCSVQVASSINVKRHALGVLASAPIRAHSPCPSCVGICCSDQSKLARIPKDGLIVIRRSDDPPPGWIVTSETNVMGVRFEFDPNPTRISGRLNVVSP